MDTPGVLVGLTWGNDDFVHPTRDPPLEFSLADEEVKFAEEWSTKLVTVQTIIFIYAYELYSHHFSEFQDDEYEGRCVVLSKVENGDGTQWKWSKH